MFGAELQARAAKLAREQRERDERLRAAAAKEAAAAERQRTREREREEAAAARRRVQLEAEQQEAERRAAELEANRGVVFRASLAAAPAPAGAAAARGIRRAADKLVLPPSAGVELTVVQDAPRNGPMFFEIAAPSGARTHASVLDFTAPEGVVLLPPKVAESLFGPDYDDGGVGTSGTLDERVAGRVGVSYCLLPKAEYVRLQPARRAFHEAFAADDADAQANGNNGGGDAHGVAPSDELRAALESALTAYCTLSEGDWVRVPHAGAVHLLRVLEVRPRGEGSGAVSIVDTDVAVDVGPSIETEGYLRAREEAAAREAERARQEAEAQTRAAAAAEAQAEAEAAAAAEEAARRLRVRTAAASRLLPEPDVAVPCAAVVLRLPDGARASRRFRLDAPLAELFAFADAEGAGGWAPNSYRLVSHYPRRAFAPGADATLAEAGFVVGEQVALFLEAHGGGGGGAGGAAAAAAPAAGA